MQILRIGKPKKASLWGRFLPVRFGHDIDFLRTLFLKLDSQVQLEF